jgi:hypothetical protein
MTNAKASPRSHACLGPLVLAACALFAMSLPHSAAARPYTVLACDSAGAFGFSSAAWTPFGNTDGAYAACPTGGASTAGVSDRLIEGTYAGFSHSGHSFNAPRGATITQVRWAGRMARDNCRWGVSLRALPSGATITGMPNGAYCDTKAFDNRGWPMPFATPERTTGLQQLVICAASECQPGAAMHSHVLEVTVDDPIPPSISLSGPLASGRWVSGRATKPFVNVAAADNAGVRHIRADVDGRAHAQTYACNLSQPQPCSRGAATTAAPSIGDLRDGSHTLVVSATDIAGNVASVSRTVWLDNTAPDPVAPEVLGGDAWRRTNLFSVAWATGTENASPIVRAHWKLCASENDCPYRGYRDGEDIAELRGLSVPSAGDFSLHVWLEDAAGNAREASAVVSTSLRFDPEPPQLAFEPIDPADPLRVVVNAIDRHSGVASGEIEMRATGTTTWHGLTTDREGSSLVAHVDDERFRNGSYEFRARAVDYAGNEASTGRRADGSAATLRLPARIDTQLTVGVPHLIVRRRVERRHGKKRVVHRRVRRLDTNVVVMLGHRIRLSGLLSNADGQPIDGATIEALEKRPNGALAPIGLATTGTVGKFHYVLKALRNRDVLFRYAGSRRIGSASTDFTLMVPAKTAFRANRSRLFNGQQVLFTGRVITRPLPSAGKLVELQAHFRGRWRTFSTVRANSAGRWRFPYRFDGTVGRVTYRFRARVPAEGGYPFISGGSRVVKVVVTGA